MDNTIQDTLNRIENKPKVPTITDTTPADTIARIQSDRPFLGNTINETLDAIDSGKVNQAIEYDLEHFGNMQGAPRYIADIGLGAAEFGGQVLLTLPEEILSNVGTLFGAYPDADNFIVNAGKGFASASKYYENALNKVYNYVAGTNPDQTDRNFYGGGSALGFAATSALLGAGLSSKAMSGLLKSRLVANLLGGAITGTLEATSEAGKQLADLYAKNPKRFGDALKLTNIGWLYNAPTDAAIGAIENIFNPLRIAVPNYWVNVLANALSEQATEIPQEIKQQMIENAIMQTFNSGEEVTWSNLNKNLGNEVRNFSQYWDEIVPEAGASTLVSSAIMNFAPIATKRGRIHAQNQVQYLKLQKEANKLSKQRETLQSQINDAYQENTPEATDRARQLREELSELDDQIADTSNTIKNFFTGYTQQDIPWITPEQKLDESEYTTITREQIDPELDKLKTQRDNLRTEIDDRYLDMDINPDSDLSVLDEIQGMEDDLSRQNENINNFWDPNSQTLRNIVDNISPIDTENAPPVTPRPTVRGENAERLENLYTQRQQKSTLGQIIDKLQSVTYDIKDAFDFSENDKEVKAARKKIYMSIKDMSKNKSMLRLVSHVFASGAKTFSQLNGTSINDYLDAVGFKIVQDFSRGADYYRDNNGNIIYDIKVGIDNDGNATKVYRVPRLRRGNYEHLYNPTDTTGKTLRDAFNIITLMRDSDASTLIHEGTGHFFLDAMIDLHRAGKLKGRALDNFNTIINWLGIADLDLTQTFAQDSPEGKRLEDAHEKFAVSAEQYFFEGYAPTSKLRRAFEAFKNWMRSLYYSVRSIKYTDHNGRTHNSFLSDEIREVFDDIFSNNQSPRQTSNSDSNTSDTLSMFTDEENNAAQNEDSVPNITPQPEGFPTSRKSQEQIVADAQRTIDARTQNESQNVPPVMAGIQEEAIDDDNDFGNNNEENDITNEDIADTASNLSNLLRQREEQAFNDNTPLTQERKFQRQRKTSSTTATNTENKTQTQHDEESYPHPNDPYYNRCIELYAIIDNADKKLKDLNLEQSERDKITKELMEAREELYEINQFYRQNANQNFNEIEARNNREFNERDSGANSGVQGARGANVQNAPSLLPGIQDSRDESKSESPNEKRAKTRTAKTQSLIDSLNAKIDENSKRQEIIADDEPDTMLDNADPDAAYESDYDISSIASSLSRKLAERESESYNQSAPLINDGEILAGRFIFSTKTKPYSLNVIAQADNKYDRLSRQRGRALELRNNRGDVFATYYPYTDTFTFNYTGTNHSQEWKRTQRIEKPPLLKAEALYAIFYLCKKIRDSLPACNYLCFSIACSIFFVNFIMEVIIMLTYKSFQFMGQNIRAVCNGDEVFFVAGDVSKALKFKGGSFFRTLANLPDNERITCGEMNRQPGNNIVIYQESGEQEKLTVTINSKAMLVTEAGLYRLIMKSKVEGARRFQNWILHEVIPSLRKTGRYQMENRNGEMTLKESAVNESPELMDRQQTPNEYVNSPTLANSDSNQFTQNESLIRSVVPQEQIINIKDDEEEFTLKHEMQLNINVRTPRALMRIETTFFDGASEDTIQAIHQTIHQLEEILRLEISNNQ